MLKNLESQPNPDLIRERTNASVNIDAFKDFFGEKFFESRERHRFMRSLREKIMSEITPFDYNFSNLTRMEKYDNCFKQTIPYNLFLKKYDITKFPESLYLFLSIQGLEKEVFSLHEGMVRKAVKIWGTEEQIQYWLPKIENYEIVSTYAQTELGHGTFVRGLETTATLDKETDEFVIDSPKITSYKYWPGTAGKTVNTALVMAKLVIDDKDYGIHGFMVPLRDPLTHKPYPNIEVGDIGTKCGYNSQDNGYIAFHRFRIPRFNMFMNFAQVSRDGKFTRTGNNEKLMYASMLLTRATMCMSGAVLLSMSLTISIRYSCVRRQTANPQGIEPPVLDYQTQQYRLFPALSTCYALYFTAFNFRDILNVIMTESNNLRNISNKTLAKLHAISSAIKGFAFEHVLHYAQISRLCCGGHGYSSSSGLGQVINEADAGCSYEGDNIVLYLQTARYLLKCAQNNESPYFQTNDDALLKTYPAYSS